MGIPQLDTCCCGCTLKTGTMIIGIFDSIVAAIVMIVGITSSLALASIDDQQVQEYANILYIIFIVSAVFSAIQLIVSIFLVAGAAKNRPGFLLPWIIYVIIYVCIYVAYIVIIAVSNISAGFVAVGISSIASALIGIFLQIYFVLVVYSLYRNLNGEGSAMAA